jgi:AraC-like DNA-binding protein
MPSLAAAVTRFDRLSRLSKVTLAAGDADEVFQAHPIPVGPLPPDGIPEFEIRPEVPWCTGEVRERCIRPGVWMHWGSEYVTGHTTIRHSEIRSPLLFTFAVDGGWEEEHQAGKGTFRRESGKMAVIHGPSIKSCSILPSQKSFHVTICVSEEALGTLLEGDGSAGARRLRQVAAGSGASDITLPMTSSVRMAAQTLQCCPYQGAARTMILEARCSELMAEMMVALTQYAGVSAPVRGLAAGVTEQIEQAATILREHLEMPPSLLELARKVGLSETTLKRGFQQVYQNTPFGYLRSCRMEQARSLLESGRTTVLEAASYVGYCNPSNFATAFRRQFGVNPKTFQLAAGR